jgi:hypothetical protein
MNNKFIETLKNLGIILLVMLVLIGLYFLGGYGKSNGYYAADPNDVNGDGFYYIWVEE